MKLHKATILIILFSQFIHLCHAQQLIEYNLDVKEGNSFYFSNSVNTVNSINKYDYRPTNDVYYNFTTYSKGVRLKVISFMDKEYGVSVSLINSSTNNVITNKYIPQNNPSNDYLEVKNLPPGSYSIIVEGVMENGDITTWIECTDPLEFNVGTKLSSFEYTNTTDPTKIIFGNSNGLFYRMELINTMNLLITNTSAFPSGSSISLLDSSKTNVIATMDFQQNNSLYSNVLFVNNVSPGIYYVVSKGKSEEGSITTKITGINQNKDKENSYNDISSNNYVRTTEYKDSLGGYYMTTYSYYDGLGYPVQTLSKGASPLGKDIVSLQEYDESGRESLVWQPIPTGGTGTYVDPVLVKATAMSFYSDGAPYSNPIYESSPLNRVLKQFGPGQAWQNVDKSVKTDYLTNTSTGNQACTLFEVQADQTSIQNKGLYANSELYVTQVTDEDTHIVYEFKDKAGQVVLKRAMNGTTQQDTYFVYDDFGRLRYVLPPSATDLLTSQNVSWNTSNSQAMMDFAYYYQYDGRGNCILKKLPGCAPIRMVYDMADRLILSQDGNQKLKNEWTYFLYDAFGRQTVTGQLVSVLPPDVGNAVVLSTFSVTGSLAGYTANISIPSTNIVSVNYYDDYQFIDLQSAQEKPKLVFTVTSGYDAQYTGGAKGLLTGTRTYQLNAPEKYTVSANYYDHRGRIVQTHATNHLGGFDDNYFCFTFTGKVTGHRHVHSAAGKATQTEVYSYTYDHAERLQSVTHQLNDNTAVVIAENKYDEVGRLQGKTSPVETISYQYNVRGWMTQAAGTKFKETLAYNDAVNGLSPSTPYYGGNISAMKWQAGAQAQECGYRFSYDGKGQLTQALYGEGSNVTLNNNYNIEASYDKMGNIKYLYRRGKNDTGFASIDDLSCSYKGNQLSKVTEGHVTEPTSYGAFNFVDGADVGNEYIYDANGNLTEDYNKKIAKIEYNSLNLPSRLQFSNGNMAEYVYDGAGRKLNVTHLTSRIDMLVPMGSIVPPQAKDSPMTLTTDYCGNMIYENGSLKMLLIDDGYITFSGTTPVYHYYLKDHLGNNRMVVRADGTVEQTNSYYPFGGWFFGINYTDAQPYKYNGKELDHMHGLDCYDYGARHYDPSLARWMCMDPKAEKYYDVSPYAYCGNNPMNKIDPDGRKLELTGNITMSLAAIQSTFPQSLRSYVRLQDGYIDLKSLEKGLSTMNGNTSGNYQSLYNIVSDPRTVEFSITDKPNAVNASGSPSTGLIHFGPTEFFPDDNFGNKAEWVTQGGTGISLAPKSHQFTQWDKSNRNKLLNEQQQFSSNENYQVQINSSMYDNKATYKNGAIATTHELYGHILFMLMGWDSTHGTNRNTDNQKLEIWLKERANETNDNF